MARKRTALAKIAITLTLILITAKFTGAVEIHWVGALSPYVLNFLLEALGNLNHPISTETN